MKTYCKLVLSLYPCNLNKLFHCNLNENDLRHDCGVASSSPREWKGIPREWKGVLFLVESTRNAETSKNLLPSTFQKTGPQ